MGDDFWPPDVTMLALVGHLAGDTFTVTDGGDLALTVQSEGRTMPFSQQALDELEARGWVALTDGGRTEATERGRYWGRRWLTQRLGKGVLKRVRSIRATGGVA